MQTWAVEVLPAPPPVDERNVSELSLDELRAAIQANVVSFPSQVPTFTRIAPAEIQWRIVQLYFLRGWSTREIGKRYDLTSRERVRQILRDWKRHAIDLGYIQPIPRPAPPLPAEPF